VTGIEIAQDEAAWGQEQFNLNIVPTIEDLTLVGRQFDIITLWDVIEHVPDVHFLLQHCFNLLHPGGVLVLKTPNADGLLIKPAWWSWAYLQLYWLMVYPAIPHQHIYHFTPTVMKYILQDDGFAVRSVETWQNWNERIMVGHNWATTLLRILLMRIAWKTHLPYEMTIWAQKN
jgi:2-polyprenyl-3-methyl-5-hydroxy-6-metoxy-1,4-benzoquinol methylase